MGVWVTWVGGWLVGPGVSIASLHGQIWTVNRQIGNDNVDSERLTAKVENASDECLERNGERWNYEWWMSEMRKAALGHTSDDC